ncbi:MAG: 5'/3'-nucleotidase SurE [Acidobacteria bacterium]|nr:MAG: 5'/3'-nucleotidase SurE [Acidobacteriota bacterium]
MSDPQAPPRILVSNDDGFMADGLRALVEAMESLGEVWVAAPEAEQSASSHAISIHRPLRIREVRPRWFAVDGTPTDCSYIGVNHLLKDRRPALMVSGINHGPNLADDVTYSGTVAAAMEASLLGVPAIAFSLVSRGPFDFGPAARFARQLAAAALREPRPPNLLINVNVPGGEPKGYAVTRLGKHSYGYDVIEKEDPRGRKYYWIGGNEYQHEDIPGSDCNAALREGLVSVTPLHLDLTATELAMELARWTIEGFARVDAEGLTSRTPS